MMQEKKSPELERELERESATGPDADAAAPAAPADTRADVLVAGAGLTGLGVALALAHAGMTVILADDAPDAHGAPVSSDDPRATALTVSSLRMLERLGAAPSSAHRQAVSSMTITGDPGGPAGVLQFTDSDPPEKNQPLAWIAENSRLTAALTRALARALTHNMTHNMTGDRLIRRRFGRVERLLPVAPGDANVGAVLSDGGRVFASLCVAADGARSPLRGQAGLAVTSRDYRQDALTVMLEHNHDHGGCAFQDMLPGGPFALLPLTGRRSAVVWSMPRPQAGALMGEADIFADELSRHLAGRLGGVCRLGGVRRHELKFLLTRNPAARRLVLAGDAAHVIHPLAGLGFNLALRDAATLADVLSDASQRGEDPGTEVVLKRYCQKRRFDVAALAGVIDGMNGMFSSPPPLRWIGAAALDVMASAGPVRRWLSAAAAGSLGMPPELLRPDPPGRHY